MYIEEYEYGVAIREKYHHFPPYYMMVIDRDGMVLSANLFIGILDIDEDGRLLITNIDEV